MRSSSLPALLLAAASAVATIAPVRGDAVDHPRPGGSFLRRRAEDEGAANSTSLFDGAEPAVQCQPCPVCDASSVAAPDANKPEKIKLRFLVPERSFARLQVMLEQMAEDYTRKLGESAAPEITIVGLPTLPEVKREITFDVFSGSSQFDGYIMTPLWIGELAEGLYETTQFLKDYGANVDPTYWTDILLSYREVIARYDNKLYLFPFDGDVFSMFYRRDLLEKYNKRVPKTWDEYNELAAFFHGKTETVVYENGTEADVTLSGSCVGRMPDCGNSYWAQAVLATMTQTRGMKTGSLIDPSNFDPLLGPAMEETLRLLGEQTLYGPADEFDGCVGINVDHMNQGKCVLTYNWGNSFSDHVRPGSTVKEKLGVAPIPGSPVVLNRESGKLEECTMETCPHAVLDERSGKLINQAPYLAYGGFSGAVSGSVSEEHQKAAAEFFAFASSAKKAIKYVIPDVNHPELNPLPTGMDPYAKSMLQLEEWTNRGFDEKSSQEYLNAIESSLGSPNAVIELRMPEAGNFMATLDAVTTKYCNDTKHGLFEKDPASVRVDLSKELAAQWRGIVAAYDSAEGRSIGDLLKSYQKDRGVYVERETLQTQNDATSLDTGIIVAIAVCAAAVIVFIILLTVCLVKQSARAKRDAMWYVDPNDVHDTKEVLGRGSFGVVTKGFLRGTPVALKHAKGWEPDLPLVTENASAEEGVPVKKERDLNRASQASSFSNNDAGIEDTIGATLLTEPTTQRGGMFHYFFPGKQKQQTTDDSIRAELLLLVKLRHDNIVQTYGASQDVKKKQLVLILQYMENGPIRNILKDPAGVCGTAGMSLEIQWALQVARGLNFLHTIPPPSGPMVHADLKSSNVLLDSSYNANISDFGLATRTMKGLWGAIQRTTKSNNPRGSILWMAPEVLNGADPTPASDVYSYSMFLVELMTRDRPYGLRLFEGKSAGGNGALHMSMTEVSVGTEFDRKGSICSIDRRESELSDDFPSNGAENAEKAKEDEDKVAKKAKNDHRVSWSVMAEESSAAVPVSKADVDDDSSKKTSSSKFKAGQRDFYTVIDGETLSRDDVVARVKDMALDPPFRPTLPDNAPQVLVDICTECWQKNPKRRPTMKEVEERLAAAVSSTTLMQQLMRRGSVFDSILPPDVQDKLAKGEMVKPTTYDNVTVVFSDIVGFTSLSSALTAEETGDLIFRLFTQFDSLSKDNGVKKLDVIGDAFLGVTGVPNAMPDHASRAARFALDAIKAAQSTLICPAKPQLGYVKVRFGLASGSAVATVIGSREHPKYTLFGDAVNTASRMESTSKPNKCQVTEETANLIRGHGDESISLVPLGKKEVKGKGTMETFFVEDQSSLQQ